MRENPTQSVCLGLNIQGMNPSLRSRSFWKVQQLTEELIRLNNKNYPVPFLAVAETWIKPHITDAQINIKGYQVFRSDRKVSQHGGVLLYINDNIHINNFDTFDDDICSGVICLSKTSNCIISCIYRVYTILRQT